MTVKIYGGSGLILPNRSVGNQGVKGRWSANVWHDRKHRQAFLNGDPVKPAWSFDFPNGITDVGIHYLLEAGFRGGAAISAWYALLIDNAGFTGVAAADTSASHSGWTESTVYDEAVRQTLAFGAAATRKITDAVSFTINTNVTIQGLGVISVNTKGDTTGTLFSTALITSPPSLIASNVFTADYTLSD